jgi:hypothetical protein
MCRRASSIFPYAYFMIQSFEVSEHDIVFYSGVLIAVSNSKIILPRHIYQIPWVSFHRISTRFGTYQAESV